MSIEALLFTGNIIRVLEGWKVDSRPRIVSHGPLMAVIWIETKNGVDEMDDGWQRDWRS